MKDAPLWAIIVVLIQVFLLILLLFLIARRESGWRSIRVGFFAEREDQTDQSDERSDG